MTLVFACVLLLLLLALTSSVHSYESRMSGRGYNLDPNEANVAGTDNLFSREDDCVPDVNGMFGSEEGVEQPLDYYYQIEMLPLILPEEEAEEANNEIIGKVETSVSKTLLPSLFVEQCALTERTATARSGHHSHRKLVEMRGITTLPQDTMLEGVECDGELSNDLNECHVVDGTMTLYSDIAVDELFLDYLQSIIRDAMTQGDYNELDPRIVNVSYRESLGGADASNVGTTSDSAGGGSRLPAYAWVFIGVGAVASLFTLGAIFNRRRRNNQHDDAETGSFPAEPIGDEPLV